MFERIRSFCYQRVKKVFKISVADLVIEDDAIMAESEELKSLLMKEEWKNLA